MEQFIKCYLGVPKGAFFTWPTLSKHRPWGNLAVAGDVNHHTGDDSSLAFRYAAEQILHAATALGSR